MKKQYTIGEIGKILGLTNDAIRFYEKKDLVHPQIDPENRYRMYTLTNVLELLDVIYYRHLDIPVDTIYDLSKSPDPEDIVSLLEQKAEQTKRKIYYEQQLLKKLEHFRTMFYEIERNKNICSIRNFPESVVLFEGHDREDFFIHDIQYMSQDQFVLCAFYILFEWSADSMEQKRTFVSLDVDVLKEMDIKIKNQGMHMIKNMKCVHLAVRMKDGSIDASDINRIQKYAKENQTALEHVCYVREIPMTFYNDLEHYYAEIFVPVKGE